MAIRVLLRWGILTTDDDNDDDGGLSQDDFSTIFGV
jgi:hypothetical protein